MSISFIAMNRMLERRAAENPALRRRLERNGKVVLSQARALPDDDLLARLRSFDIELDPRLYRELCNESVSAEEISLGFLGALEDLDPTGREADWIWLSLVVLWERWFPDLPSFEQLDDRIQEGYERLKPDRVGACEIWLQAWDDVLKLCGKGGIDSIEAFDNRFGGTQSLFNWVQDLEMELGNESRKNPQYHGCRLRVCEQFLDRFVPRDSLLKSMRRALAESCFGIGDRARGDELYTSWLKEDPQWGWGWIGWADNYFLFAIEGNKDPARAEELLHRGLSVEDVKDRDDLLERLEVLLEEQGRIEELDELRARRSVGASSGKASSRVAGSKATLDFVGKDLPIDELPRLSAKPRHEPVRRQAIGRNEPCPCGSGKKYKKCCGR